MKTKKLLSLFLTLLILTMAFVGCKKKVEDESTGNAGSVSIEPSDTGEEVKATLDLPTDLRYDGAELNMLIRHNEVIYHESDGFGGDGVKAAVYQRNAAVTNRLGVTIKYENLNGYVKGASDFQTAIRTASMSGNDGDYDVVLPNSFVGTALIIEGIYADLAQLEYIDLDQPYWWKTWTENGTINGKTYSVTGDFNVSTLGTSQVVYFNKAFMEHYDLDTPYELMEKNEWTIDKMLQMSKQVTEDLNQDGKYDESDRYGFITNTLTVYGIPVSCGIPNVTRTNDTTYEFTFASEKASDLVDKFRIAYNDNSMHFYNSTNQQEAMLSLFNSGNAMFMWDYAGRAETLRSSKIDYGIVPTPKYNSEQENYTVGITGQAACFILKSMSEERVDRAAAVLQACGYYSYEILTPAYFDTLLCLQSTNDAHAFETLNMLHEITYFGLTDIFSNNFKVVHWFKECFMSTQSPQGWWAGVSDMQNTSLENLITYFEGVQ